MKIQSLSLCSTGIFSESSRERIVAGDKLGVPEVTFGAGHDVSFTPEVALNEFFRLGMWEVEATCTNGILCAGAVPGTINVGVSDDARASFTRVALAGVEQEGLIRVDTRYDLLFPDKICWTVHDAWVANKIAFDELVPVASHRVVLLPLYCTWVSA